MKLRRAGIKVDSGVFPESYESKMQSTLVTSQVMLWKDLQADPTRYPDRTSEHTFALQLATMVSSNFTDRPFKKLALFDVDGTLTPARQVITPFSDLYTNSQRDTERIPRDNRGPCCLAQENCHRFRGRVRPYQNIRAALRQRQQRSIDFPPWFTVSSSVYSYPGF